MQPHKLLLLLSVGAMALKVPGNLRNGMYRALVAENGMEITFRFEHDSDGNEIYQHVYTHDTSTPPPEPETRYNRPIYKPLAISGNASSRNIAASLSAALAPVKRTVQKISNLVVNPYYVIMVQPGGYEPAWEGDANAPPELDPPLWGIGRILCNCYTTINSTGASHAFESLTKVLENPNLQTNVEDMLTGISPDPNTRDVLAYITGIAIRPGENRYYVEGDAVVFICNAHTSDERIGGNAPMRINGPIFVWIQRALSYSCGQQFPATYERYAAVNEAVGVKAYVPGVDICSDTKSYDMNTCPGSDKALKPKRPEQPEQPGEPPAGVTPDGWYPAEGVPSDVNQLEPFFQSVSPDPNRPNCMFGLSILKDLLC